MKSDESIIGLPSGVIKAKTVRRLPKDQRWCVEEVLSIHGIPSNSVPGVGRDRILIKVRGSRHAERGEDEHGPAQEHEMCDILPTVAAPGPTVRRMYITRAHIREYGAAEGCPGCMGIEARRSMPQNSECRTRTRAGME